jgi:tetratricopeptide (TPR) repeat protein
MLDFARSIGAADPHRGADTASLAGELADLLRVPPPVQAELKGEALVVLANCRRLAANWQGAIQAIKEARRLIKEPAGEARLYSIHASVSLDTGNFDLALELLQKSAAIYRRLDDVKAGRRTAIQSGATLLVAGRVREAVEMVETLDNIGDSRLEILARGIVIEGLVKLGRKGEALQRYLDGQELWEQVPELRLRVEYLEAILLQGFGCHRDAERLLREQAQDCADAEQYKEAFRTFLVLFESHFVQGALDKAAKVCDQAIEVMELAGDVFHGQMREAWSQLGAHARLRTVTIHHITTIGHYMARHWNLPATCGPFQIETSPAFPSTDQDLTEDVPLQLNVDKDEITASPHVSYRASLEQFDADLIRAALERHKGEIRATARELEISKNTLKARMAKYGIGA